MLPLTPDRELLREIPMVLRARDFHLYLDNGKRLTDLWLHGGKAILGHKPHLMLRELKNSAERGLFCPFPHFLEKRLLKALGEIFPGRIFRLYPDTSSLSKALENASRFAEADFAEADFAKANFTEPGRIPLWRPFTGELAEKDADIMIPVLPCPLGPEVLVIDKNLDAAFPQSELISPVILAAAARAVYNLVRAMREKLPKYVKIEKALKGSVWRRKGVYLIANGAGVANGAEGYKEMFRRFLEGGFLLPPSPVEPAILPMFMSPGEEVKLAGLLSSAIFS